VKPRVRVTLADDGGREFFGAGVAELLGRIDRAKSIQGAAREMELSYVKALRILRGAEEGLGVALVERRKGGFERGGAVLTEGARRVLETYARVGEAAKAAAEAALRAEGAGDA
jgi:molybdate transport repressor ModE-like protein